LDHGTAFINKYTDTLLSTSLDNNMYIDPDVINKQQVSYIPKTPEEWAKQALLQAHSTPAKAMAKMELLRGVEFRPGRNIKLFDARNCEAALAYSRGQLIEDYSACRSCRRGNGPFRKCIMMKGYMSGSCSNCHCNGGGKRCSFRNGK
jgi:hypothetical protein